MKLLLRASALGFVLIACAAAAKPAPRLTAAAAARPSVQVIAARRERAATRTARKLLSGFALPPGARRSGPPREYGGALRRSGPVPPAEIVDVHRFWSVHKSLATVAAFVIAHRPRGFKSAGAGEGPPGTDYRTWSFEWPSLRTSSRLLNVTAARLRGRTVLRVDAIVVWVYPRSPGEKVPAGVREIILRTPRLSVKVREPAKVARIVRWFDGLPISPPGVAMSCPLVPGAGIVLSFRSARGGLLAQAKLPPVPAWVCTQIDFRIGGRPQPPLVDCSMSRRDSFVGRLQRLLGVRLLLRYR